MAKKKKMNSGAAACPMCHECICGRCKGSSLLVVGVLVLVNAVWSLVDWWLLVGLLIALKGLLMLLKPNGCGHS